MKIVIAEPITSDLAFYEILKNETSLLGHELVFYKTKPSSDDELIARTKNAEMLVLSTYPLTANLLEQLPSLQHIVVAFTGLDHIDLQYCHEHGILVTNTPGYATQAVAEQTVLMMLMLLRNAIKMHQHVLEGKDREGFLGLELSGKTVGIIGFGRIGRKVAEICGAFGAQVVVAQYGEIRDDRYQVLPLDELLSISDIVTLHVPLKPQNVFLLNRDRIFKMKKGAFLVNTARGKIVDYLALKEALEHGHLEGAALDVFDIEPPLAPDYPILKAPRVIFFPHTAYATKEAIYRRSIQVKDIILQWLKKMA